MPWPTRMRLWFHVISPGLNTFRSVSPTSYSIGGSVDGLALTELRDADVCCGFGGTFCVKYPEVSAAIVSRKAEAIRDSGAGTLLAGDLGCLLNLAGRLAREGSPVEVRHVAEVLAGMADGPAIGAPRR